MSDGACPIIETVGRSDWLPRRTWGTACSVSPPDWPALCVQYTPELVQLAERKLRCTNEEARDLAQEVVAEWLARVECCPGDMGCQSPAHFVAILCVTMSRRHIDRLRKSKRSATLPEDFAMPDPSVESIILLEHAEIVRSAFARLPAAQRSALLAVYVDGERQEDVAERIGVDRRIVSQWKCAFESRLAQRAKEVGLDE